MALKGVLAVQFVVIKIGCAVALSSFEHNHRHAGLGKLLGHYAAAGP